MPEYMKALYERFKREVPEVMKLECETDEAYEKLRAQLEKPERKLLLELTNLEDCLQYEIALYSFIEGYRLAWGIFRELTEVTTYSFYKEQEQLAAAILAAERNRD